MTFGVGWEHLLLSVVDLFRFLVDPLVDPLLGNVIPEVGILLPVGGPADLFSFSRLSHQGVSVREHKVIEPPHPWSIAESLTSSEERMRTRSSIVLVDISHA